eukprot:903634-Rhodomonas_salina.1
MMSGSNHPPSAVCVQQSRTYSLISAGSPSSTGDTSAAEGSRHSMSRFSLQGFSDRMSSYRCLRP